MKCGMELPIEMVYKTNHGKGTDSCCKQCRYEAVKARREAKKAKIKEAQRKAGAMPIDADKIVLDDGTVLKKVEKPKALSDYTSRELLVELKNRGYQWGDMWHKTQIRYQDI